MPRQRAHPHAHALSVGTQECSGQGQQKWQQKMCATVASLASLSLHYEALVGKVKIMLPDEHASFEGTDLHSSHCAMKHWWIKLGTRPQALVDKVGYTSTSTGG
eukprot:1136799-Pelagomonas_calceolata.AAC.3